VVPDQPAGEHGGLVEDVGVEVVVAKTRLWRVQGGVGELNPARFDERGRVDAGD